MATDAGADEVRELGNFPADEGSLDIPPADDAASPEAHTEPPPSAEPAVAEPTPPAAAGSPEPPADYRALQQQIEFLQRELHLQRATAQQAAMPQQPQADPMQEAMARLSVTPEDWNEMLANPKQGAQWAEGALRTVLQMAVGIAEQRLVGFYQQDQARLSQERQTQTGAEQMRTQFWSANADLQPFEPIVQHYARQVAEEQDAASRSGRMPLTWEAAQQQVALRTRAYLQQHNIGVAGAQGRPAARGTGIRPAVAEMGGRGGGSGQGRLTGMAKHIADIMQ